MTQYLYNHLYVRKIEPSDRGEFPGYPLPWWVIVDDTGAVLGDGKTAELAKADVDRQRPPGVPSPEAAAALRRQRRERKARKAR